MTRKDKMTNKQRELAAFTHCAHYLADFIRRYERPRRKFSYLPNALAEVEHHRQVMIAEQEGAVLTKQHGNVKGG